MTGCDFIWRSSSSRQMGPDLVDLAWIQMMHGQIQTVVARVDKPAAPMSSSC
jgi:hypothetical protein